MIIVFNKLNGKVSKFNNLSMPSVLCEGQVWCKVISVKVKTPRSVSRLSLGLRLVCWPERLACAVTEPCVHYCQAQSKLKFNLRLS
jgi:hypothetical protein